MSGHKPWSEIKHKRATPAFNLFAYRKDHQGDDLRRHGIPRWNLDRAVAWALGKGCDTILIELHDQPVRAGASRLSTHHVCCDPACPGGC